RDRRAGGVLRRRLLLQPHLLARLAHPADDRSLTPTLRALRPRVGGPRDRRRCERAGQGAAHQAIVGLGGQVFMRPHSQDAIREFRPYFDNAPVYGHGPPLEEYMAETPLTVGSPQQVIERTLGFREYVGDYQRQLFLIDHAGLPLKTVLAQLDLLRGEA